jgi:hypothetical protein
MSICDGPQSLTSRFEHEYDSFVTLKQLEIGALQREYDKKNNHVENLRDLSKELHSKKDLIGHVPEETRPMGASVHTTIGSGIFTLHVFRAEGIPALDQGENSDPYVCCTWGSQQMRTTAKESTLNPVWNETLGPFIYDLNDEALQNSFSHGLYVSLYDKDIVVDDELFGELFIKPQQFMNLSLGEIHCQWYPIYEDIRYECAVAASTGGQLSETHQFDVDDASNYTPKYPDMPTSVSSATAASGSMATAAAAATSPTASSRIKRSQTTRFHAHADPTNDVDRSQQPLSPRKPVNQSVVGRRGRILIGFQWQELHLHHDVLNMRLRVHLPCIGLSLVNLTEVELDEVLYVTLSHLSLEHLDSNARITTEIKVQNMQIDTQTKSTKPAQHVLLYTVPVYFSFAPHVLFELYKCVSWSHILHCCVWFCYVFSFQKPGLLPLPHLHVVISRRPTKHDGSIFFSFFWIFFFSLSFFVSFHIVSWNVSYVLMASFASGLNQGIIDVYESFNCLLQEVHLNLTMDTILDVYTWVSHVLTACVVDDTAVMTMLNAGSDQDHPRVRGTLFSLCIRLSLVVEATGV